MSFSFSKHEAGCSPLEPCLTCRLVAFLRNELQPHKFAEFLELCGSKPITYDTRLEDLYGDTISVRTVNCLHNENIRTLGDLVRYNESEILRIPNLGRRSLNELKEMLASIEHSFGELPSEPRVIGGTDA
jgi:DNA-directed RNA polymerase alpha subunit